MHKSPVKTSLLTGESLVRGCCASKPGSQNTAMVGICKGSTKATIRNRGIYRAKVVAPGGIEAGLNYRIGGKYRAAVALLHGVVDQHLYPHIGLLRPVDAGNVGAPAAVGPVHPPIVTPGDKGNRKLKHIGLVTGPGPPLQFDTSLSHMGVISMPAQVSGSTLSTRVVSAHWLSIIRLVKEVIGYAGSAGLWAIGRPACNEGKTERPAPIGLGTGRKLASPPWEGGISAMGKAITSMQMQCQTHTGLIISS